VEVTNLAICWNDFTLLGTFYSKNSTSLIQSAGNRRFYNAGSSETTRETSLFNFSLFQASTINLDTPTQSLKIG